MFWLPYMI
jgi:hypothetical protein